MSHGFPDYGVAAPKQTTYALSDMAELAARLGSINTFDRRGDIIWFDDFEENINKWAQVPVGVGASIALSTNAARSRAKSAKLTTGNLANDYALITRSLPVQTIGRIGFEHSFSVQGPYGYLEARLTFYSSLGEIEGALKLDLRNKRLYYHTTGDAWNLIASNVKTPAATYLFHTLKFTVDFDTQKYLRAILNNTEYDLTSYALYTNPPIAAPLINVVLKMVTDAAFNRTLYVDDVIITQNEP